MAETAPALHSVRVVLEPMSIVVESNWIVVAARGVVARVPDLQAHGPVLCGPAASDPMPPERLILSPA